LTRVFVVSPSFLLRFRITRQISFTYDEERYSPEIFSKQIR